MGPFNISWIAQQCNRRVTAVKRTADNAGGSLIVDRGYEVGISNINGPVIAIYPRPRGADYDILGELWEASPDGSMERIWWPGMTDDYGRPFPQPY